MGLFSRKNMSDFSVPILQQIQQEEESKSARKLKAEEKALEKEKKKRKKAEKNNSGANVIYEDYDDEDDVEVVAARNHRQIESDVPEWVNESSAKKEEPATEEFVFGMEEKSEPVMEQAESLAVETMAMDETAVESLNDENDQLAAEATTVIPEADSPIETYNEEMEDEADEAALLPETKKMDLPAMEEAAQAEEPEEMVSPFFFSQTDDKASEICEESKPIEELLTFVTEEVNVIEEPIEEPKEVAKPFLESFAQTKEEVKPLESSADSVTEENLTIEKNMAPVMEEKPVEVNSVLMAEANATAGENGDEDEEIGGLELDLGEKDVFDVPDGDSFPSNATEPVRKKKGLSSGMFGGNTDDNSEEEEEIPVIPDLKGRDDDEEEEEMAAEQTSFTSFVQMEEKQEENEEDAGTAFVNSVAEEQTTGESFGVSGDSDSMVLAEENGFIEEEQSEVREVNVAPVNSVPSEDLNVGTQFGAFEFEAEEEVPSPVTYSVTEEQREDPKTYSFDMEEAESVKAEEVSPVPEVKEEASGYTFAMEEEEPVILEEKRENIESDNADDGYSFELEESQEVTEPVTIATETVREDSGYNAEMEEEVLEETSAEKVTEAVEQEESDYSFDMEEEETEEPESIVTATSTEPSSEYRSDMEEDDISPVNIAEEEAQQVANDETELIQAVAAVQETPESKEEIKAAEVIEAVANDTGNMELEEYHEDMEDPSFEPEEGEKPVLVATDEPLPMTSAEIRHEEDTVEEERRDIAGMTESMDEGKEVKKVKKFVSPIPLPSFQRKEKAEKEEPQESNILRRYRNKRFVVNAATMAIGLGCLLACFGLAIKTTVVASGSMEPTLMTGDVNVFNRLAYVKHDIQRGDIITFWSKEGNAQMSKRVIGIAGDHIEFHDGFVFINGLLADESLYLDEDIETNCSKSFDVPEGCVFVLGDNRENSIDSRFFENPYISESDIIGKYLGTVPRIW